MKKKIIFCTPLIFGMTMSLSAQMHIGGQFYIDTAAAVAVAADVYVDTDIAGRGAVILNSNAGTQELHAGGHVIPGVRLDNTDGVRLRSAVMIGRELLFEQGKVYVGNADLTFAAGAVHTGAGIHGYIVTDSAGLVTAEAIAANDVFTFPVGQSGTTGDYTPVSVTNKSSVRKIQVQVKDYDATPAVVHNRPFGIGRAWQITSDISGDAEISLTHNETTEGTSFTRNAAFVTQQEAAGGTRWSIGTPGSGTQNGYVHSGIFLIPVSGGDATAFFSKSSHSGSSLGPEHNLITASDMNVAAIAAYPNPFVHNLVLNINCPVAADGSFLITDVSGREVSSGVLHLNAGMNHHTLSLESLSSGAYLLHLPGIINNPVKIVKQ